MFINGNRVEKIYKAKNGATRLRRLYSPHFEPSANHRNIHLGPVPAPTPSPGIVYIIDGDLHRETYPSAFTRDGNPTIADALDFLNQDYFYPLSSIFGAAFGCLCKWSS